MKNRLDHAGAWMLAMVTAVLTRWEADDDPERDRGDVPGWVMITVMSAVLVVAILALFRGQVTSALTGIFDQIKG